MKKIFIYYSLTGNGDLVSECFKEHYYVLRKVEEKHKLPKSFFFRIMFGGFRAGLGLKGKLVNYDNNVSEFDEVVIGSPIWNGRFPPAINSVLAKTDLSNKKLIFVFYSGSGEGKKALKKVQERYKLANVIFLQEPLKHKEQLTKLEILF